MFEKVNPSHPDKLADRIAGALVDMAYAENENAKIAVEVLIGHGHVYIINETDSYLEQDDILKVCKRITGENVMLHYDRYSQDEHLRDNQAGEIRCGDNGIFKGVPVNWEEKHLCLLAEYLYSEYPYDGKYLLDEENGRLTICQSNIDSEVLINSRMMSQLYELAHHPAVSINPIGDWTGGMWVDSGATNRKLGSDLGRAVTGGGIHGKDLSKADVTLNIWAHYMAQKWNSEVTLMCSIGDEYVQCYRDGEPWDSARYEFYVNEVRKMMKEDPLIQGSFEKLAEWGLVRWSNTY